MTEVVQVGAAEEPQRDFLLLAPLMTGDRRVSARDPHETVHLPPLRTNAFLGTSFEPIFGATVDRTITTSADPALTDALEAAVAALSPASANLESTEAVGNEGLDLAGIGLEDPSTVLTAAAVSDSLASAEVAGHENLPEAEETAPSVAGPAVEDGENVALMIPAEAGEETDAVPAPELLADDLPGEYLAVMTVTAESDGVALETPEADAGAEEEWQDDLLSPAQGEEAGPEFEASFFAPEPRGALPLAPARSGAVRSEAPESPASTIERARVEDLAVRLEEIAHTLREHGPARLLLSQARDPLSALIAGYLVGYLENSERTTSVDTAVSG